MLSIVPSCQKVCSRKFFAKIVAIAMDHLFGWKGAKISLERKAELFQHVFSPSSVKIVVHWFQMILSKRLTYYQHPSFLSSVFNLRKTKATNRTPSSAGCGHNSSCSYYDLSKVSCPVAVIAGASDGVIDAARVRDSIPNCALFHLEPEYEHLDLIWADDAHEKIFPLILEQLKKHNFPVPRIDSVWNDSFCGDRS
jgi:pimeloyl-ACP methyl ester carboxylesterase